jgi:SEC-C motif domain protein
MSNVSFCPCGSGRAYAECCQPCHKQHKAARSAVMLMRARYSAYVLKLADYLLMTWHPDTRPATLNFKNDFTHWLGLEIVRQHQGSSTHSKGRVEFKAKYQTTQGPVYLHEISRFQREHGVWYYVDGVQPGDAGT